MRHFYKNRTFLKLIILVGLTGSIFFFIPILMSNIVNYVTGSKVASPTIINTIIQPKKNFEEMEKHFETHKLIHHKFCGVLMNKNLYGEVIIKHDMKPSIPSYTPFLPSVTPNLQNYEAPSTTLKYGNIDKSNCNHLSPLDFNNLYITSDLIFNNENHSLVHEYYIDTKKWFGLKNEHLWTKITYQFNPYDYKLDIQVEIQEQVKQAKLFGFNQSQNKNIFHLNGEYEIHSSRKNDKQYLVIKLNVNNEINNNKPLNNHILDFLRLNKKQPRHIFELSSI